MEAGSNTYSDHIVSRPDADWISPYKDLLLDKTDQYAEDAETIVDVGCGPGELLQLLADNYDTDIRGVDFSSEAVAKANERTPDDVEVHEEDAIEFLGSTSSDLVYASNSMQAMDPEETLEAIYNHLEEDGVAIVVAPDEESGDIFPEKASIDTGKTGYGIQTPLEIDEESWYRQHLIPESWIEQKAADIGFESCEVEGSVPLKMDGLPYMVDIIEDGYAPEIDQDILDHIRDDPEGFEEMQRQNPDIGPKADIRVLKK